MLELLAVARHGSLSGAAEAIGVSQPALSQSIAVLEHGLGVRVLDRDRHGARLTEFGKTLVFHAQALESLLDRAKVDTRLRSLGVEGLLALGITPITAVGLVPIALESLLRDTPNVSVSVVEDLDDKILSMLRARELDLVISRLGVGPDYPDVETEPLLLADWSLILRSEHPLASLSSVSLKDLDGVKWVLPAGGSAFRRQLENMFATAGIGWPTQGDQYQLDPGHQGNRHELGLRDHHVATTGGSRAGNWTHQHGCADRCRSAASRRSDVAGE
ncbi:MAG: LysR family transcriptional regulator [Sulfuritalea sp.]|nr:LysR family transcriptional regulator [Sulfuritalea sp.]